MVCSFCPLNGTNLLSDRILLRRGSSEVVSFVGKLIVEEVSLISFAVERLILSFRSFCATMIGDTRLRLSSLSLLFKSGRKAE